MTAGSDSPIRVCPRCGTVAGDGVWCSDCGLNLRQQEELPTAQEFAARQREQAWLTEQAEKEREAADQERLRRMAENQQRRAEQSRQWEEAKQRREQERAAKNEAKIRQKAGRKRSRVALALIAVGVLLLAGGGIAAYVLVSGPERAAQDSPPVSVADEEPTETTGSDSECSTGQIPSGAYTIASMDLTGAVTCADAQEMIGALLSDEGVPLGPNTTLDGTAVRGFLCFGPKTGGANCTREEDDSEVVVQLVPAELEAQGPQDCADFETAGPTVFGVETVGIDCSEASDFILAWEEEGPGATDSCSEPDGTFVAPCEYRGWACNSIQSGYESSAYDCGRGDQSIRWESGF